MFKHEKMLFHPVAVEKPNPQYAALLQEQLGGGNGELKGLCSICPKAFESKIPRSRICSLTLPPRSWVTWRWWRRPSIY